MPEFKTCPISAEDFEISDAEIRACERMQLPTPDLSPHERLERLMATRNERRLYRRKCDASGKELLSAYAPDAGFKVYSNEIWWGDSWSAAEYGRDFDFHQPFFSQFAALQQAVPREGTSVFNSENCAYNSHIRESRNCYLNSLVHKCEDCAFCYWVVGNKDVFDCGYTNNCTLCYQCIDVENCYNCVLLQEASNCSDCFFSYQLKGCKNCLFSSNLSNKSYYLFNQPCKPEEFERVKSNYLNGSWKSWQKALTQFEITKQDAIHRAFHNLNTENSIGDHLINCKNCLWCFDIHDGEDCVNTVSVGSSKDAYSSYSVGWHPAELVYQCAVVRGSTNLAFCTYTWHSSDLRYCDSVSACHDCFGCIGLRQKRNCILNKAYTKQEYDKLLSRIVSHMQETGEWGKFFPPALSPFAYNESAAQDFFPRTRAEAEAKGYRWKNTEPSESANTPTKILPDNIADVMDTFTKEIVKCQDCDKSYRLIQQELNFYRKMKLPAPHSCPECRHQARFIARNPYQLFERSCDHCKNPTQSTYAPARREKVYCEECYKTEFLS